MRTLPKAILDRRSSTRSHSRRFPIYPFCPVMKPVLDPVRDRFGTRSGTRFDARFSRPATQSPAQPATAGGAFRRPSRCATAAASTLFATWSFAMIRETCTLAVFGEM